VNKLKRYLITGLVVVTPVFLTVYILFVAFRFTDNILGRILNVYLRRAFGFYIPGLGLLLFLFFIIIIGFLTSRFFGKKLFKFLERRFANLPMINKIYPIMKQVIRFILAQQEFGFKKVVLAEYPSKGIWSIGFITNEQFKKVSDATGAEMVAVLVPNSPGPLTGSVIFVAKENLRFPDLSVSDALKIIISGGVFKP
jgi:uncharacterized membrane protein